MMAFAGSLSAVPTGWRYSNTDYDLLGKIVRIVDWRPVDQAINARIIVPLGLSTLRALPLGGGGAAGLAPLASAKEKPIDPSRAGAAGPIVGSAGDMVRFWSTLLDGHLMGRPLVAGWRRRSTRCSMPDLLRAGAIVFDVPDSDRRILWVGHAGSTPGAGALVAYAPPSRAFAVAMTSDGSAAASANALLKAIER